MNNCCILLCFIMQVLTHLNAMRQLCMFCIMIALWLGAGLHASTLWSQVGSIDDSLSFHWFTKQIKATELVTAVFFGGWVCLVFAAPVYGPSVKETVKGDTVIVTWTELPRGQRGGCITQYTIYLENSSGKQETCKYSYNYVWMFGLSHIGLHTTYKTSFSNWHSCSKEKWVIAANHLLYVYMYCTVCIFFIDQKNYTKICHP